MILPYLELLNNRTSPARKKMEGKRNRLGRVLRARKSSFWTFEERDNWNVQRRIQRNWNIKWCEGDSSRGYRIINHYTHHGTVFPICHGGSEAVVVTEDVLHCIEIWKLQRPSIYTRKIQNRLLLEGICDKYHKYRQIRDDSEEAYKCSERIHRQKQESGCIFGNHQQIKSFLYAFLWRSLFISPIKIRVLDWVLIWIFHSSLKERTIETSNEIKFPIMNSFIHPWQEHLSCFDCNGKFSVEQ